MISHRFLFLLLLLLPIHNSVAQEETFEPLFENIDITKGLPHNTVQKIFQDSEGYMWFATKDGLCRYDGYNFIVYCESLVKESISNSKVRCIAEDAHKNIWVGTDNGLNCINLLSQHILSFFPNELSPLKSNKINELYFDPSTHLLWIATDKGITWYDTDSRKFITPENHRAFNEETNTVGKYGDKEIYIGTHNGLYIYDIHTKNVRRIQLEHGGGNINVLSVWQDTAGDTWIGNNLALLAKVPKGESVISLLPFGQVRMNDDQNICCIIEQKEILWLISKRRGIFFYNKQTGKLLKTRNTYSLNPLGTDVKERIMLTSGYKDNNGNIWVGSYYMGLFLHSRYMNHFTHIPIERTGKASTGIIGSMVPDGQGIWLGSDDLGITYYNPVTRTQQYYELYNGETPLVECKPLLIHKGALWVGTESHGIHLFDLKTKQLIGHYTATSQTGRIPGNRVNCALQDSNGYIWIGFNGGPGGICRFNEQNESFTTFYPSNSSHKVRDVYFIYEASDNELWIGTRNNGLFCYNIAENVFTPIPVMGREDLSVSYIYKDKKDRIWIGTFGQGLVCMDSSGEVKQVFNTNSDHIGNNICGILEDNDGRIWISSFYEIAYYNEEDHTFIRYDAYNGFPLLHVKSMSCFVSERNLLYFGGSNGLVEVVPKDVMHVNKKAPKVVLTDFLVHNQSIDTLSRKNIRTHHRVELKYNQDNLTFAFAALSYIYPDKNLYRYRLQGIDKEWNLAGTQRQVTYSNLGAGEYQFQVCACNSNGTWSEPSNLLSVIIKPAPWRTWWAYLAYTIVILALLALFFYYLRIKMQLEHDLEIKNIEKKNLDKMHKFRLDLFTNFSHEIRTPLTLISGSLTDLLASNTPSQMEKGVLQGVQRNVMKIMKLVNQLMDFRKHDEGRMELLASKQHLIPFIKEVILAFSELSRIQNHPLKIHLPETELIAWYNPQLLEKVFYNVLMNAFKYSNEESVISLNVDVITLNKSPYRERVDERVKEAILISVFNEGDIIPEDKLEEVFEPFYRLKNTKSQQGTGIGLSFNRMIMRLHHSDIWVENIGDTGVVFKFLIPIGKDHLREDELCDETEQEHRLILTPSVAPKTEPAMERPKVEKELRTLLVVEDNNEIRQYLKSKLATIYNVFDCDNGHEALEIIHRREIDLVISDVMIPVMDGIELCKAIKSNIEINHIPVILLTAHVSDTHVKDGLSSGANDYVFKPFNFDLLLARIQNLLDNNERLRQSFQKRISPKDMNVEVTDYDEQFLQKCYDFLRKNLTNSELTIEDFGKELGVSRVHLYRKIKYLTNLSPSRFILNVRLKVAADLLRQEGVSVSDVCYQVGFNNLSYFTRTFKESYGVSPSDYQHK